MADKSPEKRAGDSSLKEKSKPAGSTFFERHLFLISFFAVFILTFLAYGGSVKNGFVWDDETFIVNNKFVHDISLWPQYFTAAESISSQHIMARMYRPVQTLSFAIDAAIWDNRAGGFHLTSLILHIATCLAIIFSFRNLIGIKPSAIGAVIFAVHPALSEGALSLASRGNQLYTLFGLISLGFFVRTNKPFDRNHIFSIISAALAFFSKEPAIALIAVLPLIQIALKKPWKITDRRSVLLHMPFLFATIIYLTARSTVVDTSAAVPYWGGSLWATLQMQAKVFSIYLYLLIWPFNLKARYSIKPPETFPDFLAAGAMILNIALIVFALLSYSRSPKTKLLWLAVLWFYLSLAPVSNIFPIPGSMMGERFIYFTFAGIIPLLASSFQYVELSRFKTVLSIFGIAILTAFLVKDIQRTPSWKDNASFFTLLSKQSPEDPAVQIRMAQEEISYRNISSALNRLEHVMRTVSSIPMAEDRAILHYWYGYALLEADRPSEAYKQFTTVANLKTTFNLKSEFSKDIVLLLAESAARSNDLKTARLLLEQEVKSSPQNDAAWNGLGNALQMMGDKAGAVSAYRRAVEINPSNTEAAINLKNLANQSLDILQNKR